MTRNSMIFFARQSAQILSSKAVRVCCDGSRGKKRHYFCPFVELSRMTITTGFIVGNSREISYPSNRRNMTTGHRSKGLESGLRGIDE